MSLLKCFNAEFIFEKKVQKVSKMIGQENDDETL